MPDLSIFSVRVRLPGHETGHREAARRGEVVPHRTPQSALDAARPTVSSWRISECFPWNLPLGNDIQVVGWVALYAQLVARGAVSHIDRADGIPDVEAAVSGYELTGIQSANRLSLDH